MGPILKSLPIRPNAQGIGAEGYITQEDELLWFEYLAVSPSYELARRDNARELTAEDRAKLPADFDRVLSVYDNLGDVQAVSFDEWWRLRGSTHLQAVNERSTVELLGTLARESDADIDAALAEYRKGQWVRQGMPDTMILAIPKDMPAPGLLRDLKGLIDWYLPKHGKKVVNEPTYKLAGKRMHWMALLRYLYVLYYRANLPDAELWQIGAHTQISQMHSPYIDPVLDSPTEKNRDRRDTLGILTSRALWKARMISENAARGVFPSHVKVPDAVKFNFADLRQSMVLRDNRRVDAECKKKGITRDQYVGRQLEKLVKLLPHER